MSFTGRLSPRTLFSSNEAAASPSRGQATSSTASPTATAPLTAQPPPNPGCAGRERPRAGCEDALERSRDGPQRALPPRCSRCGPGGRSRSRGPQRTAGRSLPVRLSLPPRGSKVNRKNKVSLWCALPRSNSHTRPCGTAVPSQERRRGLRGWGPTQALPR